jgi:hypothetical protein
MSDDGKKFEVQYKSYLGSERTYWHGNSCRVALPSAMVEKLNIRRGKGKLLLDAGERKELLFFETDKGILLKMVDEKTGKKLKDIVESGEGLLGHSLTESELEELIEALKKREG